MNEKKIEDILDEISKMPSFKSRPRIVEAVRGFFRNIKYGITNLIHWLPIIWNDRDWDWAYTVKVLKHKLSRQKIIFEKYSITLSAPQKAKELSICIKLLDRLEKDEYRWFPEVSKRYAIGHKHGYKLEKSIRDNDRQLLFKIMHDKLLTWWD